MADQSTRHFHCPHCGYDLTGLTESRCPECGGEFNWAQLARNQVVPTMTFGRALLRMLWLPAASTVLGMFVGGTLDNNGGAPAVIIGCVMGGALLIAAVITSHRFSRRLGVSRAALLGIDPYGRDNRPFMTMSAIGLFCCQGVLAAGGFFGGCACLALSHLNVH
jgi:hypothetical protein